MQERKSARRTWENLRKQVYRLETICTHGTRTEILTTPSGAQRRGITAMLPASPKTSMKIKYRPCEIPAYFNRVKHLKIMKIMEY